GQSGSGGGGPVGKTLPSGSKFNPGGTKNPLGQPNATRGGFKPKNEGKPPPASVTTLPKVPAGEKSHPRPKSTPTAKSSAPPTKSSGSATAKSYAPPAKTHAPPVPSSNAPPAKVPSPAAKSYAPRTVKSYSPPAKNYPPSTPKTSAPPAKTYGPST